MGEATKQQFEDAERRGRERLAGPRAQQVHYDAGRNRIVVRLTTGVEIGFAPQDAEGLQNASAADLRLVRLDNQGLGIHFPTLDADLYVPALLEGVLGSERWMAEHVVTHRRRAAR